MSKWISGYLPNRSGSYLVKSESRTINPFYTKVFVQYKRFEFDSVSNKWLDKDGYSVLHSMSGDNYIYYWWDEYSITENKIVKKLKFK